MGSPITLSGFNKIDFTQILNAVMTQERAPLDALQARQTTLQTQTSQFSTLNTKLTTLQTAVDALKEQDSLAVLAANTTDATAVGVSTTTGTVAGSYSVVVSELARAQVLSSTSTYTSLDDVVATGGSITLTSATGDPPVTVTLTGSTTIAGLANAINAKTDSPVAASVVQTAPGTYKLMLTSKATGTTNGFTVTQSLTGGVGVTFTDTNGDGTYGDSAADNTQTALNAAFTVNGLAVTSATNTVTDVIPGATLTLKKKDPTAIVTIDVTKDIEAAKARINKFITAYNDLTQFAKDQNTAAVAGRDSISRDPILRSVREELSKALGDEHLEGGTFTRLAAVGLGMDITGKLTLDSDIFQTAVDTAPADLQNLFSAADGTGGVFGALHDTIDGYTKTGGYVDSVKTRNDDQVSALGKRLDTMETQLEIRRAALQKEMIAADMAMTNLNSQSAALSSVSGGYRLF